MRYVSIFRADLVARVFDTLGFIFLMTGSALSMIMLIAGLSGSLGDTWLGSLSIGLVLMVAGLIYTAVLWGLATLASLIAAYIWHRS